MDKLEMEEKEAQAEFNFKTIKDKVLAREGLTKYHYSNKDFVE